MKRAHGSYVTEYKDADDPIDANPESNNVSDDLTIDDGQSIIGVSIGPEQTRLASPEAYEQEKSNALSSPGAEEQAPPSFNQDELEDAIRYGGVNAENENAAAPSLRHAAPVHSRQASLPSRWTSLDGIGEQRKKDDQTSGEKSSSPADREDLGWKKYIPTLPSLSQSISAMTAKSKEVLPLTYSRTRSATLQNTPRTSTFSTTSGDDTGSSAGRNESHSGRKSRFVEAGLESEETRTGNHTTTSLRPHLPRRTTSDGSLYLHHTLSRASSLGDDTRWTDIHEQVNSRGKAIRDSIADSNLKLPRLPDLPSFNMSEVLADFQATRKRSASALNNRLRRAGSPVKRGEPSKIKQKEQILKQDTLPAAATAPGMTRANAQAHPQFTQALRHLKGDLVILGGYRGSILRSAQPPHRQLWVPVKVGLGIRKVNLEVGFEPEDEERSEETVIPGGMLKNIGPVDISRRLFKQVSLSKNAQNGSLRVWDFGYDWRLSPHRLSAYLIEFLESLKCNSASTAAEAHGATIIAHSLGGLLTRHAVNKRPELVAGILYAGVPQTCVNILGPLRNGDEVLLSSRVLTAQINFSIRTTFALLPLDGQCFLNRETKERFDVDFFDPQQWEEYRWTPCIARPLPRNAKPQNGSFSSIMGSMSSALPSISLTSRNRANSRAKHERQASGGLALPKGPHAMSVQMDMREEPTELGEDPDTTPSTMVTVPKHVAMRYLTSTLAEVKQFKQELAFNPEIDSNGGYPPTALMYGKAVPTVFGAYVKDRESIKCADAYDDLAFASGDGVVLARAAQLPEGYKATKGGVVSSNRGHINLLGDLEAVGRCLNSIHAERRRLKQQNSEKAAEFAEVERAPAD